MKFRLPITTYVILALLIVDFVFGMCCTFNLPWPMFVIGLSYLLMILGKRIGLILFGTIMFLLSLVILIPSRTDYSYAREFFFKVGYPVILVSIAMAIRKNGTSAFRIIWGH